MFWAKLSSLARRLLLLVAALAPWHAPVKPPWKVPRAAPLLAVLPGLAQARALVNRLPVAVPGQSEAACLAVPLVQEPAQPVRPFLGALGNSSTPPVN